MKAKTKKIYHSALKLEALIPDIPDIEKYYFKAVYSKDKKECEVEIISKKPKKMIEHAKREMKI